MDKLQQIKSPINTEFEAFKQKFDSSLQSSNLLLNEVLSHIKQRRGKMMRPMLVMLVAKSIGNVNKKTRNVIIFGFHPSAQNCSREAADILRRAISKKDKNLMESMKKDFILSCTKKGYDINVATQIFSYIEELNTSSGVPRSATYPLSMKIMLSDTFLANSIS